MFGDSDLSAFFGDFGVDLVFNGVTVKAIDSTYDQRDSLAAGYVDVVDRVTLLEIPYNAFNPMPKRGDTVTAAGAVMKVRDPLVIGDGGIVQLYLVKYPYPHICTSAFSPAFA
ncbi:MAG: hypothetical protein ACJ8AK_03045 [Gemmatimonadaceae bacterium]